MNGYGRVELTVTVINYLTEQPIRFNIRPIVIDTDFELTLGLRTIKQQKQLELLECVQSELHEKETEGWAEYLKGRSTGSDGPIRSFLTVLRDKDDVLSFLDDSDEIDYIEDVAYESPCPAAEDDPLANINARIFGSPELQTKIRNLCFEFKTIFCRQVRPVPAKIKAMKLTVNTDIWELKTNRGAPRTMSAIKQLEIKKQIDKMLSLGVIEESNYPFFNQIHMQPKPEGKWRFCLDFRNLNDATADIGGPIPNIEHLMIRIGECHSRYFGVIDLTSGYHQAPLDEESRKFTTFTSFAGNYQWTRVPMGLKGAPSYFQQNLQAAVLRDLMYRSTELYLDDCIVHAKTEELFVSNFVRYSHDSISMVSPLTLIKLNLVPLVSSTWDV